MCSRWRKVRVSPETIFDRSILLKLDFPSTKRLVSNNFWLKCPPDTVQVQNLVPLMRANDKFPKYLLLHELFEIVKDRVISIPRFSRRTRGRFYFQTGYRVDCWSEWNQMNVFMKSDQPWRKYSWMFTYQNDLSGANEVSLLRISNQLFISTFLINHFKITLISSAASNWQWAHSSVTPTRW